MMDENLKGYTDDDLVPLKEAKIRYSTKVQKLFVNLFDRNGKVWTH